MKLTETEIEIIDAKLEKLRGIYRERAEKLEALGLSETGRHRKEQTCGIICCSCPQ